MNLRCRSANEELNASSHNIVTKTMRDLFEIQQSTLDRVRMKTEEQKSNYVAKTDYEQLAGLLEEEKLDHTKTRILLQEEKEKCDFLKNQSEILEAQMKKDKENCADMIKSLQNKASRETKRCDFLINKLSEAEHEMEKQHDLLQIKNAEITDLKKRLKLQKENHKHKLEEMDIAKMQELYLQKTLSDSQRKKASS